MSIESVCAAYVRGEIEVDELERRLERAVAAEAAGTLPRYARPRPAVKQVKPWPSEAQEAFARDFCRRHSGPRASAPAQALAGGWLSVNEVRAAFSVPPPMLGKPENR